MADGWKVLAVFMATFLVLAYFATAFLLGTALDRLDNMQASINSLQAEIGKAR